MYWIVQMRAILLTMSLTLFAATGYTQSSPDLDDILNEILSIATADREESDNKGVIRDTFDEGLYWNREEKCDRLFETPVPVLPGGSFLKKIMGEQEVQAHYALSQGGTLRLTITDVGRIPVSGSSYIEAYRDLFDKRPLQDSISRKADNHVVLADVKNRLALSYYPKKNDETGRYQIKADSLTLILTAKVRVTEWTEYSMASIEDQKKWDRLLCQSYHHELGHILVAAQILEEAEADLLNLNAESLEALQLEQKNLFDTIGQRNIDLQNDYHDALDMMGKSLGRSKPYLELPFAWLKRD